MGSLTLRSLSAFRQSWPFMDLTPAREMCWDLGAAAAGLVPVRTENNWINIAEKCALRQRCRCRIFGRRRVQHPAPPVDEGISAVAEINEPHARAAVLSSSTPSIIAAAAAAGGHYCRVLLLLLLLLLLAAAGSSMGVGGDKKRQKRHTKVSKGASDM